MRKPRPLAAGSTVRVIAPSSPFERENLPPGLKILTDFGLVPTFSDRVFERDGYLAGADEARASELVDAMTSGASEAVLPVRGGYGAMRYLRRVADRAPGMLPRLFMGFSDVTAIHRLLSEAAGLVSFHGPNVLGLARLDAASVARTRAALLGLDRDETFTYGGLKPLYPGRAQGRLVAGNLSLLTALAGTRFAAPLDGTILVVEDVGEPAYRIDRMLMQVALQPDASRLAAVVFGDMGVPEGDRPALDRALYRFTEEVGVPAVTRFPVGHGGVNYPVPEGVVAELDADAGVLRVVEDPYA